MDDSVTFFVVGVQSRLIRTIVSRHLLRTSVGGL